MEELVVTQPVFSATPRKRLNKPAFKQHSQALRRTIQFAFLLLNLWIGVQFYLSSATTRAAANRPGSIGRQVLRVGCRSPH